VTPAKHLIVLATLAYCIALYPAVLDDTERRGFDAPIYWQAARGNTTYYADDGHGHVGWVYSDRLLPALAPLRSLPYPWFLALLHGANAIGVAALMAAILRRTGNYPILAGTAAFVVGAKASDFMANGNCTGMLVGLSLTPWGALLACAVKPYYGVALVLHAAAWGSRKWSRDETADEVRQLRSACAGPGADDG